MAKAVSLFIVLLAQAVLGNISFPKPYVSCEVSADRCLRGQYCGADKVCKVRSKDSDINIRRSPAPAPGDFSLDGKCGPNNGGLLCDPNSNNYNGACCSGYGWCGSSPAHCGEGCVSGPCTGSEPEPEPEPEPSSITVKPAEPTSSVPEPSASPSSAGEPVISMPSNIEDPPKATGVPTTDGSCGSQNNGMTCTGWSLGGCCSMYGWCGDSSAHCGEGCQSGPCTGGIPEPVPGPSPAPITNGGKIEILGSSGVPAMHAGLLPNGKVFFLDKVEDYTELKLPNGQFAYSSEYDPDTNTLTPLAYKTNAFCSGGTYLANGDVIAVGGNGPLDWLDPTVTDGFDGIRYLSRSASHPALDGQSWKEPGHKLASKRWYPSVQTLPDGKIFVVSGSLNGLDPTVPANNNPTYEILSASGIPEGRNIPMDLLVKNQPYYMYPFMHLLRDGNMFIFTAKSSIIFNVQSNTVVKELPDLAGDYRTYPNTGGSVMLPLSSANNWAAKVMICGGGPYQDITAPTEATCGVIAPESADPKWDLDSMPEGRVMVEGTLLPDGTVLWVNGANRGAQGFELAENPTLRALLYDPTKPKGSRWTQLAQSTIPRLYHSVALLLLDGTLLIAGSNPHEMPIMTAQPGKPFITEFRVERFTPPYLEGDKANMRPTNVNVPAVIPALNQLFTISFNVPTTVKDIKVSLYHGGFVTHSVHMNHRMLFLNRTGFKPGQTQQTMTVRAPPNKNVAPPGDYVVYIVADGTPSVGKVVRIV